MPVIVRAARRFRSLLNPRLDNDGSMDVRNIFFAAPLPDPAQLPRHQSLCFFASVEKHSTGNNASGLI